LIIYVLQAVVAQAATQAVVVVLVVIAQRVHFQSAQVLQLKSVVVVQAAQV
jgi:hypothetical protein